MSEPGTVIVFSVNKTISVQCEVCGDMIAITSTAQDPEQIVIFVDPDHNHEEEEP